MYLCDLSSKFLLERDASMSLSRLFPKVLTRMYFADNVDAIRFCLVRTDK